MVVKRYNFGYPDALDEKLASFPCTYRSHNEAMGTLDVTGAGNMKFMGSVGVNPTCTIFPPIIGKIQTTMLIADLFFHGGATSNQYVIWGLFFPCAAFTIGIRQDNSLATSDLVSVSHITGAITQLATTGEFAAVGLSLVKMQIDVERTLNDALMDEYSLIMSVMCDGVYEYTGEKKAYGNGNHFRDIVCPIILTYATSDAYISMSWMVHSVQPFASGVGILEPLTR